MGRIERRYKNILMHQDLKDFLLEFDEKIDSIRNNRELFDAQLKK